MIDFIQMINPIAWIITNVIIAYTTIALSVFVIMYYVLFDPRATTGGKLIFRFMLSMVGSVGLVFIGVFVDPIPDLAWFIYPGDHIDWWRPLLRLVIYGYVSFTITSLAILLVKRKWFPEKVRTAPRQELVKVRRETGGIQVPPSDTDN